MVPKENQPKDAVVKVGTKGVLLRCTVTDTHRVTSMEWAATVCINLLQFYCFKGLVSNYRRGSYKTGQRACEVLPLRKGGAKKVLVMLKGGHKKFWGRLYTGA